MNNKLANKSSAAVQEQDNQPPPRVWMHNFHNYLWASVADDSKEDGDVAYVPLDKVLAAIPTSWLDSLLTGPDAVIGKGPWGCPDIERLLAAIKQRIVGVE